MFDPVNGTLPVSAKDATTPILPLSRADNRKVGGNNSRDAVIPVNKANEALENIENNSREAMEQTVKALKDFVESNNRSLKIQVHQGTGDIIVKVVSEQDGSVIREIPPEKLRNLVANLEEFSGALFDKKA
jgi:flagellar protein FlaG